MDILFLGNASKIFKQCTLTIKYMLGNSPICLRYNILSTKCVICLFRKTDGPIRPRANFQIMVQQNIPIMTFLMTFYIIR